jgi:hypothetical protein
MNDGDDVGGVLVLACLVGLAVCVVALLAFLVALMV